MPEATLMEEEFAGQLNLGLWKRVLRYAWVLRKYFIPLLIVSAATAALDAAMYLAIRGLIDEAVAKHADGVWRFGMLFVAMVTAQVVCVWAFIVLGGNAGQRITHDIRRDVFARLQELSFSYYDRRPVGWLMARATSDCGRLGRLLAWGMLDLCWGSCMMVALLIVMLAVNWKLAMIVLCVVPPLALVSKKFQALLLRSSRQMRKTNSLITGAYNEGIVAVRTTKTLVREESNLREFQQLTSQMYDQSLLNATQSAKYLPIVQTLGSVGMSLALWFGGISTMQGMMSIGTLFLFINCAARFFDPVQEMARVLTEVHAAQASAERVMGLVETQPEIKDLPEVKAAIAAQGGHLACDEVCRTAREEEACRGHLARAYRGRPAREEESWRGRLARESENTQGKMPSVRAGETPATRNDKLAIDGLPDRIGEIVFRNVSFTYDKTSPARNVLEDFSLTVRAGQTVALVGPTGGGKSTIVSLLCRFYEPTSGEILIDGVDYRHRSLHWLQSNLGIVLQTPHLFSGTIRENIRYGRLSANDDEVAQAARLVNAEPFILASENGYDSQVGQAGSRLSTGQKQLISLARAVLANPKLFVMDEATSSVDTETERLIQRGVEMILKGRTSFVIAHRLSTIRSVDRILVIDHGRIVEQGTHHELILQRGRYYELYTNQFTQEKQDQLLRDERTAQDRT